MKKPEHQWETRLHRAVRQDPEVVLGTWTAPQAGPEGLPPAVAAMLREDARAEAFELRFADGRCSRAVLGLAHQWADAAAAADPDLSHAVACWLAARGAREQTLVFGDASSPGEPQAIDIVTLGRAPELGDVRRLITLAPSNAEVVDALGAFGRVVACEDSSDWPAAVADCERLGPDLGPDLDRVAQLQPDLVLSSLSVPGMERVVTGLRSRGVPQLVLAPRSLADVMADIERTGAALGLAERAASVVQGMRDEVAALEAGCSATPRRVYLEWWPKPMFTPGAACYSNELIRLAGGVNVFGDRAAASVQITAQELVEADPEVCFVSWCGVAEDKLDPANLIGRPGLQALAAARAGLVFRLDEAFSGRPGPRMLEAARRMAAALGSLA